LILSTCVGYNKDGSCVNFAYCTKEKNVWRFTADACDAQFRTCRAVVDDTGVTKSYIARTLDTGYCTKDNVGCRTYTLTQDTTGAWKTPVGPNKVDYRNDGIYFNNKVSGSCGANSDGCSAFKLAQNTTNLLYLRQAPDYLKCYDSNLATPQIEYPKTASDLAKLQPKKECSNYAGTCIPDEVSCNWFTPLGTTNTQHIPHIFHHTHYFDQIFQEYVVHWWCQVG
jgi:hypothetical protein